MLRGFYAGNHRLRNKREAVPRPESDGVFQQLGFKSFLKFVGVFREQVVNELNGPCPPANCPFGPSGAGGATSLELGGMVHGWPVFETPKNED
ncbi:MAG: hypothetical protein KBI43_06480 [Kiritimatiellae bacterium]|nr:hypothetical protein [Kiritimatiellia bacterium]